MDGAASLVQTALAVNIKHLEATHKLKTRNKPPHGLLTQASRSKNKA
jgi:hypothetical protein